jgi:hypothetical protein
MNEIDTWLKCKALKEKLNGVDLEVTLQDDTTAKLNVSPTIITKDKLGETYLRVEEIGRRDNLVYIKLPQPTLEHGHNITVKAVDIKKIHPDV